MGWLMAVVVNADAVDELLGASELVEGKLSCGPATAAVNVGRAKAETTHRDGRDRSDGMVTPVWSACVKPSTYMSRCNHRLGKSWWGWAAALSSSNKYNLL